MAKGSKPGGGDSFRKYGTICFAMMVSSLATMILLFMFVPPRHILVATHPPTPPPPAPEPPPPTPHIRHSCKYQAAEDYKQYFRSQFSEDKRLMSIWNGVCNGTYIEVGAYTGEEVSNTFALHKALGWKGVLIELIPEYYNMMKWSRPLDALFEAAVCAKPQKIHYVQAGATSSIWEFTPVGLHQWWHGRGNSTLEPDCVTLQSILDKYVANPFWADVFSVDVFGAELEVLKGIDWARTGFGMIFASIDQNRVDVMNEAKQLLSDNGYIHLYFDHNSAWWVNRRFWDIYRDQIPAANMPLKVVH